MNSIGWSLHQQERKEELQYRVSGDGRRTATTIQWGITQIHRRGNRLYGYEVQVRCKCFASLDGRTVRSCHIIVHSVLLRQHRQKHHRSTCLPLMESKSVRAKERRYDCSYSCSFKFDMEHLNHCSAPPPLLLGDVEDIALNHLVISISNDDSLHLFMCISIYLTTALFLVDAAQISLVIYARQQ